MVAEGPLNRNFAGEVGDDRFIVHCSILHCSNLMVPACCPSHKHTRLGVFPISPEVFSQDWAE